MGIVKVHHSDFLKKTEILSIYYFQKHNFSTNAKIELNFGKVMKMNLIEMMWLIKNMIELKFGKMMEIINLHKYDWFQLKMLRNYWNISKNKSIR